MCTPAVRALKEAYPNARISFLVEEGFGEILNGNPYIDEVIEVRGFRRKARDYLNILKSAFLLRRKKFDLIVSFHTQLRVHLFSFIIGAKERIGFNLSGFDFLNTRSIKYDEVKHLHNAKKYLELVKTVGAKEVPLHYVIPISRKEENKVEEILKREAVKERRLVGFVVGGGKSSTYHLNRRWPLTRWIALAELIKKKYPNVRILLLGDKGDFMLGETLKGEKITNLCGKLSLKETAALLKKLTVLITVDTSLLHIGSAMTKVVALFGPTSPDQFAPIGKQHKVIWKKLPCSPCFVNEKYRKCKNNKCMQRIKVNEVFEALESLLGSR